LAAETPHIISSSSTWEHTHAAEWSREMAGYLSMANC
jgi:hypothetical protein